MGGEITENSHRYEKAGLFVPENAGAETDLFHMKKEQGLVHPLLLLIHLLDFSTVSCQTDCTEISA